MRVLVYSTGIVQNELICGHAVHTHTHTHILIPSEDREPTGLKVLQCIYRIYTDDTYIYRTIQFLVLSHTKARFIFCRLHLSVVFVVV